jgi:hypothetical protein
MNKTIIGGNASIAHFARPIVASALILLSSGAAYAAGRGAPSFGGGFHSAGAIGSGFRLNTPVRAIQTSGGAIGSGSREGAIGSGFRPSTPVREIQASGGAIGSGSSEGAIGSGVRPAISGTKDEAVSSGDGAIGSG